MNTAKVTSIKSKVKTLRPLNESIDLVLSRIESNSKNTANSYRGFYKEFFIFLFAKDYLDCTWDDLISITYDNVLEYVNLLENKNSPKTVKTKLASLQSLAKELKKINNEVNTIVFDVKLDKRDMTKNEYGAFTEDEIHDLLDYAKNMDSKKAYVQYLFFKLSIITAHRLQSLLDLTWNDIKQHNQDGKNIWCLEICDKTGKFITPISDELYDELYVVFDGDMSSKVLGTTRKTLSITLSKFCKDKGIDQDGRNLVLHSLKKTSGDLAFQKTNDIVKVANHLHHTNIQTSYNTYLNRNKKLLDSPSYNLLENDYDVDGLLDNLSKEQLIHLIKGCNSNVVSAICERAKMI